MVSKNIEILYNTYLAVSRSCQNKPFQLRKDFSNFYETEQFVLVKKIERFLINHPEVSPGVYFKAPYALHPDQVFDLQFYSSPKGIKAYTLYMKSLENQPPDSEFHLKQVANSLRYIKSFCVKNNLIDYQKYITFSSNNLYPDWFSHLKSKKISKYIVFGFKDARSTIESCEHKDVINMLIPDLYTNFYNLLSKFNNSDKLKCLVTRGLLIINKQINNS